MNINDNIVHLIQLALLLGTMCVLLIFVPSLQPDVVLAAFLPTSAALLGAKLNQTATNQANNTSVPTPPTPTVTP